MKLSNFRGMETEVQSNYTYMGRSFSDLSINDDSSAFSDCNSDRSGEFPTASSQSRRLLLACATDNSDELIPQLVSDLDSSSIDAIKQAAMELRLLAKNKPENRIKIARAGAIKPLISLISSTDPQLLEYGVTAILNLSLCDENKQLIAASGAIKPLVRALKVGTPVAKENAACALLRLSQIEESKVAIGRSGAIPPLEGGIPVLVEIVEVGSQRQKEIAVAILLQLCEDSVPYRTLVAREGAIPPLVALSQSGTSRAKQKAESLIQLLRQPRTASAAARGASDHSV
nr:U-box domain-containing protein 4-like [Ipomoea batatas]GMD93862.1 U-box domain-containing protein 4-like [Ipomoea batatas]